jgi:N-methylhydantoinase A
VEPSLDLRYRGQSYSLNLPWGGLATTLESFHRRHAEAYGHRLDLPVELVNLRVRVRAAGRPLMLPRTSIQGAGTPSPRRRWPAYGCAEPVPVYQREALAGTSQIPGPALVADSVATVWVAPGWRAGLDPVGNLWLRRAPAEPSGAGGPGALPV